MSETSRSSFGGGGAAPGGQYYLAKRASRSMSVGAGGNSNPMQMAAVAAAMGGGSPQQQQQWAQQQMMDPRSTPPNGIQQMPASYYPTYTSSQSPISTVSANASPLVNGHPGVGAGGVFPTTPTDLDGNGIPPDVASKSKEELVRLHTKLFTEINIKNKIIYDLRTKENWLSAELMSARKYAKGVNGTAAEDLDHSGALEAILAKDGSAIAGGAEIDEGKVKLFQTLLHFKRELSKAKLVVEQNTNLLRESEKKRDAAVEEIAYLQSVVKQLTESKDGSASTTLAEKERQRVEFLDSSLKAAQNDISTLQSKVALWCRASKKNQEARIQAEACQRTVENEAASMRGLLGQAKETEDKQRRRILALESELGELRARGMGSPTGSNSRELEKRIAEQDEKLRASEAILEAARQRIGEFEQTMQDACNTVDELEKENVSLRAELRVRDTRLQELEFHINSVPAQDPMLGRRLAEFEARVRQLSEETEMLKGDLQKQISAREQLQAHSEEAEAELASLKRTLTDARISSIQQSDDMLSKYEQLEKNSSKEIKDLKDMLELASEARTAVEKDLDEAIDLCGALQTEVMALREKLAQAEMTAAAAAAANADVEKLLAEREQVFNDLNTAQTTANQAMDMLQESEARVAQLEEQLSKQNDHVAELEAQNTEIADDVSIISEKLARAQAEVAQFAEQCDRMKNEAMHHESLIQDLNAQIDAATKKEQHLLAEHSAATETCVRLEAEVQALRTDMQSGQAEQADKLRVIIEGDLKSSQARVVELEAELAHVSDELAAKEQSKLQLAAELEKAHEWQARCVDEQFVSTELRRNLEQLQSNHQDLEQNHSLLAQEAAEKDALLSRLQEELAALSEKKASETQEADRQVDSYKAELERCMVQIQDLENSKADAQAMLESQNWEINERLTQLTAAHEQALSLNAQAQQQVETLLQQVASLQDDLTASRAQLENALQSAKDGAQASDLSNQQEVSQLEEELGRVFQELEKKDEETKGLLAKLDELEESYGLLAEELERAGADAEAADQQIQMLSEKLAEAEAAADAASTSRTTPTPSSSSTPEELQALQKRVEELQRTNKYLLEQLQRSEEQMDFIEREKERLRGGAGVADSVKESLSFQVKSAFHQVALVTEEKDALAKENAALHRKIAALLQKLQEGDQ